MNKKAFALAGLCTLLIFGVFAAVVLGLIFSTLVTVIVIGSVIIGAIVLFIGALIWDSFYGAFGGRK